MLQSLLVVHIHVNYQHEILIFGGNMHVKSESRHFVKLEKSSNIDNTTCVLGLGFVFLVFVCDFFFLFLFIIR